MQRLWITGAGAGIGRALALAYARRGATVAVSARRADTLAALQAEVQAQGLIGLIVPVPLDVTDRAATLAAVATIEELIGSLDLVILNAGTHEPFDPAAFDPTIFDRLFAVNLFGVVNGLAAVVPRMVARRGGRVAIVSSVAGYCGLPTAAAYGATKAALINMAEALKPELERCGVGVAVINPGFVRTPLTDRNTFPMPFLIEADDAAERIIRGLASGRFEITFPRRLSWALKMLRRLPYPIYFRVVGRTVPDRPAAT